MPPLNYPIGTGPYIVPIPPITTTIGLQVGNPFACAPMQFTMINGKSFIQLNPPTPDNPIWQLSINTSSPADVGSWPVILRATLVNYPAIAAKEIQITVSVLGSSPCDSSTVSILPTTLANMVYSLGGPEATQTFQVVDSFSI